MEHLKNHQLKNSTRVVMPKAIDPIKEGKMNNAKNVIIGSTMEYIEKPKKHNIINQKQNLTKSEYRGIKELSKRKNMRVGQTDKSKRLWVMNDETHDKAVQKHVNTKDKIITREEMREKEKIQVAVTRSVGGKNVYGGQ